MRRPTPEQVKDKAEIAADVAGLILLAAAGWLIHPSLGLALAGVACLLLAAGLRRAGRGGRR